MLQRQKKKQGEANALAIQKLQGKLDDLKVNTLKGQSEAYSADFLAYLTNFIAAGQDYDWSKFFVPSTPGYMFKFKADNAQDIKEAKIKLDNKIKGEPQKKTKEKEIGEHVDASGVSPSNTVIT